MRAAVRQTRLKERLVRRSEAQASEGFNRQMQWRLKTIRLVLPKPKEPRDSGAFWFWRFELGETAESGSTKCDYESILVARAQRRRPEGVKSARGKRTRSNPPGPTKCETLAIIEECGESEKFIPQLYEHDRSVDH